MDFATDYLNVYTGKYFPIIAWNVFYAFSLLGMVDGSWGKKLLLCMLDLFSIILEQEVLFIPVSG